MQQPDFAKCLIDDCVSIGYPEIFKPERYLVPNRICKEHMVRVLEDEPDIPRQLRDGTGPGIFPLINTSPCVGVRTVELPDKGRFP